MSMSIRGQIDVEKASKFWRSSLIQRRIDGDISTFFSRRRKNVEKALKIDVEILTVPAGIYRAI